MVKYGLMLIIRNTVFAGSITTAGVIGMVSVFFRRVSIFFSWDEALYEKQARNRIVRNLKVEF
jgi:hypothetical protein